MPNTNEKLSIERYDEIITALCSTHNDIMIETDQNFDYMKVNVNHIRFAKCFLYIRRVANSETHKCYSY